MHPWQPGGARSSCAAACKRGQGHGSQGGDEKPTVVCEREDTRAVRWGQETDPVLAAWELPAGPKANNQAQPSPPSEQHELLIVAQDQVQAAASGARRLLHDALEFECRRPPIQRTLFHQALCQPSVQEQV